MRIASRTSNLLLLVLMSLSLAPMAVAQRRGEAVRGGPGQPLDRGAGTEQREIRAEQNRALSEGASREVQRENGSERADHIEHGTGSPIGVANEVDEARRRDPGAAGRRTQRACRYENRRARSAGCDFYYDDEGDYYDDDGEPMPGWSPGQPIPTQSQRNQGTSSGAAKIAPATKPESEVYTESFGPQGSNALRDRLIAGRENWLEKKRAYQDAAGAVARAEYQEQQTGRPVDPRLIARQAQAEKAAKAAHAALEPLVQQAQEQGISPDLIDLYNQENEMDD